MELLRTQAYDWLSIHTENRWQHFGTDFHPRHGVNVPQGLKFGPVYWQFSGRQDYLAAYEIAWKHLTRDHGLSFGMHSSSEFLGGNSSSQATEFCSIVEKMLSDETVLRLTGRPELGDRIEQLAFNALPVAWTKDLRAFQYYTLPNQVIAKRGGNGFFLDYDDGLLPGPHSGCHCCCYNVHMGWPKFVQNSWAATSDNGLAVLAYAPSEVTARVADDRTVSIVQDTAYPFEEQVRFMIRTHGSDVDFPIKLRIPAWCDKPVIAVNGRRVKGVRPGKFFSMKRMWKDGDLITAKFPMDIRVVPGVHNSRHVEYGPLLFSLDIQSKWTISTREESGFHEYEVSAGSPWNYALLLNESVPQKSFKVVRTAMEANPYAKPPIALKVRAQRLPEWSLAWHGRIAFDPPYSPAASGAPVEEVTLKPFGSLTLRVTDFPWIGKSHPEPSIFRDNFEDGDSVGWVVYGGGWPVRNGRLTVAETGGCQPWPGYKCIATGTDFSDFEYCADVSTGSAGDAGLVFRVRKPAMGPDAYEGYYVGVSAEKSHIEIGKADGRRWSSLSKAPLKVQPGKHVSLRVLARGSELSVHANGFRSPVLHINDNTFRSGAIGVRQYCTDANRTIASFDNIAVRPIP